MFIDGSSQGLAVVDTEGYRHPDMTHWPINEPGLGGDLAASIDHFVRVATAGDRPSIGLEEALAAHRMVDAAERSIRAHEPIRLD